MRARAPNPRQIVNIREAHHSSVLSMAASSNLKTNYQVFLSFRGADVRKNFLSHLYTALDQKGIHTFVDSEELRKGEQISPALEKAIEESRIAIIIFSEDYASSPWCLEELAKIMECKEGKGLIVFPVFYKVEPREVRGGRESYGRAMGRHESKFGADSEKVKRWKKALLDAGLLSGWDLNDGDEAELIQCIVKELSIHLDRTPLQVAKHPVGIDSRVQKLISLSHEKFEYNDVRMIGIWGPGGIGKTTIAKALYNTIKSQFQDCSFLAQVRETSNQSYGLVALQKNLLSEILYCKDLTFCSVDKGINLIQERLCGKKVMLVLDDVDQLNQLKALAGEGVWFGEGSTIIVTSRNKQLLTSYGIDCVYEVNTLKDDEARDLFGRHAFSNSKKVEIRSDLIGRALHYAGGLPLALEVLGSFLRGRKEPEWESTFRKLSKSPDQAINRVLKTSFDGLENNEREIFLHIACFFKGKHIKYIKEVLDSCCVAMTIGIEILIERSLIKIDDGGFLQMHDLVQLMGEDIVQQECPDNPGKRSRLWLYEDVRDVLCGDTGTDAVKAIVLNWAEREEITLSPNAFTNMKMLRILMLPEMHLSSRGLVRLPNELRWLKWPNPPDLDFGSGPKKVVGLEIQQSRIRGLGDQIKDFRKLKSINFSKCKSLVSIPDLSLVLNLENMILDECKSLVEVHPSVGYLDKLKVLSLRWCFNLSIFPSILKTKSLQTLNLSDCSKLIEKFPDILDLSLVPNLESIILDGCKSLVEVPPSVGYLDKLKVLSLAGCYNLRILPSILKTKSLHTVHLYGCPKLEKFPDIHEKVEHLQQLNLEGTSIKELPASIENLVCVKKIELEYCKSLTRLPSSIYKLKKLESLNLQGCSNFVMFPKNLEDPTDPDGHLGFPNLNKLALDGCNLSEVQFLESSSSFPRLANLNLSGNKFTHLPTCMDKYNDLQYLYLNNCEQLQEIPLLPSSICILRAKGCKSLQKLAHMPSLSFNQLEVDLSSCHELLRKGINVADATLLEELPEMKSVSILLNGRELPKWFFRYEEGLVSFMVPQDLYDEFLGLALCAVLGQEEGEVVDALCEVQIFVNGQNAFSYIWRFHSLESDHVWLEYFPRSRLWAVAELLQNDESHFQVGLRASIGRIKKCGFRLICRQQADDLRVVLQQPRPIETRWAFEEGDSIQWLSRKEIRRKMRKIIRWFSRKETRRKIIRWIPRKKIVQSKQM